MFWGFWSGMHAEEIFEKIWSEQLCCLTMSAGTSPTADLREGAIGLKALCGFLLMYASDIKQAYPAPYISVTAAAG